jgi:hypothetical protein
LNDAIVGTGDVQPMAPGQFGRSDAQQRGIAILDLQTTLASALIIAAGSRQGRHLPSGRYFPTTNNQQRREWRMSDII